MNLKIITAGFLLIGSELAYAKEKFTFFQSTHTRGRGDTFSASYLSHESGRLNPAALAENKKSDIELTWVHWDFFVGKELSDTVSSMVNLSGEGGVTLASAIDTIEEKFGKRHYIATQFLPLSLRYANFEVTPFVLNNTWTELRQISSPVMAWQSDSSTGLNIAAGFNITKSMKFGVAVRPTARVFLDGEFYSTDLIEISGAENPKFEDYAPLKDGTALPADIGLLYTGGKNGRFGLTWHNVMDTHFSAGSNQGSPPLMRQRFSLGWLWRQQLGRGWNVDYSFDLQDIINRYGLNYFRLIHAGVELGRSIWGGQDNDLGVQVGLAEGYPSAGLFLDLNWVRLDIARYTVELGEYPGQRADARFAASLMVATDF